MIMIRRDCRNRKALLSHLENDKKSYAATESLCLLLVQLNFYKRLEIDYSTVINIPYATPKYAAIGFNCIHVNNSLCKNNWEVPIAKIFAS